MRKKRLFVSLVTILLLLGGVSCAPGGPAPSGPTPAPATPSPEAPAAPALATTGPVITFVGFTDVYHTVASVIWRTSVPTVGRVEYGRSDQLGLSTAWTESASTSDMVILEDLDRTVVYFVRVRVKDGAGNEAVSPVKTVYIYGDRVYNPAWIWEI